MLGALRKLLGRGSERTATDGGTDAGQFSSVSTTNTGPLSESGTSWTPPSSTRRSPEAADHLDDILEENSPGPGAYVPAYESAGVGASGFVSAHEVSVDAVVDAVFDRLHREGLDEESLNRAEGELRAGMTAVVRDAATGVAEFGDAGIEDEDELNVEDDELLDGIGMPVFMLDVDGEVVAWNNALEELTGCSADEAVGTKGACDAIYADGSRSMTLAEQVLEAPNSAEVEFDVSRADRGVRPLRGLGDHGDASGPRARDRVQCSTDIRPRGTNRRGPDRQRPY